VHWLSLVELRMLHLTKLEGLPCPHVPGIYDVSTHVPYVVVKEHLHHAHVFWVVDEEFSGTWELVPGLPEVIVVSDGHCAVHRGPRLHHPLRGLRAWRLHWTVTGENAKAQ
jgi:hypothetical protein